MSNISESGKGKRPTTCNEEIYEGAGGIGPFTFLDEEGGHKLTHDTVLLTDFIGPLSSTDNLLEIGTGAGQIMLLLLSRNPEAHLTGVEVRERAIRLADKNVKANGLTTSVTLIHSDYRDLQGTLKKASFSVIASNPPYIKKNHGRVSPSSERATARSEVFGEISDLIETASYLLTGDGRLYLIFPVKRLSELVSVLDENGFRAVRLRFIHSGLTYNESTKVSGGGAAKLFLVEARRCGELTVEKPVFL